MARLHVMMLGLTLLATFGCDGEKIARLEKQNADLKMQLARSNAVQDFDLQAKCSGAAKTWFNENWAATSREKETSLLDFSNHYNKASNKCFILVEYHFTVGTSGWWMNDMTLWNVYENTKYGKFAENHPTSATGNGDGDTVLSCEMLDKKCSTLAEFNGLMQSYMND